MPDKARWYLQYGALMKKGAKDPRDLKNYEAFRKQYNRDFVGRSRASFYLAIQLGSGDFNRGVKELQKRLSTGKIKGTLNWIKYGKVSEIEDGESLSDDKEAKWRTVLYQRRQTIQWVQKLVPNDVTKDQKKFLH